MTASIGESSSDFYTILFTDEVEKRHCGALVAVLDGHPPVLFANLSAKPRTKFSHADLSSLLDAFAIPDPFLYYMLDVGFGSVGMVVI